MTFAATHVLAAVPVISSFTPTNGAPGTSVTLSGQNFSGVTIVTFNNSQAIISAANASTIVATVPLDATTGPLSVTTPGGTGVSARSFYVAPRITGFDPPIAAIGATISIQGFNFGGTTAVKFGPLFAAGNVVAETLVFAQVPVGATSGPVTLSTPAGTTVSSFPFIVAGTGPVVTNFDPVLGNAGTEVILAGANFTGTTNVQFGGTNAPFTITADTQIHAFVPTNGVTGPISVFTKKGFFVTTTNFIVLSPGPVISSFTPTSGPPGVIIQVLGKNFANTRRVILGGTNAPYAITADTQLQVQVPVGATSGPVIVATLTGTNSSIQKFRVLPPGPQISSFNPTSAPPGTIILISGGGFTNATVVRFGGTNAAFVKTSDSQIHAQVPNNARTALISVGSPAGTNFSDDVFTVLPPGPVITSFTPTNGIPGNLVLIGGVNLAGVNKVLFGTNIAPFQATSDTQIQTQVPTNAQTGPITVVTATGTGVSTALFYVSPQIFDFGPKTGVVPVPLVITGANFTAISSVRLGELPLDFTPLDASRLAVDLPSNSITATLSVTTPAGIVASLSPFVVIPHIEDFFPAAAPSGTTVNIFGSGLTGATNVLFNTTPAAFTIVSANQVTAIVPNGALTGPITIITPTATTRSSNSFVVSASVDLRLTGTASPGPLLPGVPLQLSFVVTNRGPSQASDVRTVITLESPFELVAATASRGTSFSLTNGVRFDLGIIEMGGSVTLQLKIKPAKAGPLNVSAILSSATYELDFADNHLAFPLTVLAPYQPRLTIVPWTNNTLLLGWPLRGTNFQLQSAGSVSFPNGVPVTNPPAIGASNITVILPLLSGPQFFRLFSTNPQPAF